MLKAASARTRKGEPSRPGTPTGFVLPGLWVRAQVRGPGAEGTAEIAGAEAGPAAKAVRPRLQIRPQGLLGVLRLPLLSADPTLPPAAEVGSLLARSSTAPCQDSANDRVGTQIDLARSSGMLTLTPQQLWEVDAALDHSTKVGTIHEEHHGSLP